MMGSYVENAAGFLIINIYIKAGEWRNQILASSSFERGQLQNE